MQGFAALALYIHRAVQALHCTKECTGLALYPRLYRPSTIRRTVQALHYMQGCTGPAVNA